MCEYTTVYHIYSKGDSDICETGPDVYILFLILIQRVAMEYVGTIQTVGVFFITPMSYHLPVYVRLRSHSGIDSM